MLIRSAYPEFSALSLQCFIGVLIVESSLAITVENLERSVSLYPCRGIGVKEDMVASAGHFTSVAEAYGSIDDVESYVTFV